MDTLKLFALIKVKITLMIMIEVYKDIHGDFTLCYTVEKRNEFNNVYQFVKYHLENWEVGQYFGGN